MIAVFLKKAEQGKSWGYVTEKELKAKEKSAPKIDETADPQDGLMTMMKKMYEEGNYNLKKYPYKKFCDSFLILIE